jgi:4-amino-4-deoxy-L-arabinose transferase-like glycosyltransferase
MRAAAHRAVASADRRYGLWLFVLALAVRLAFVAATGPNAEPAAWGDDWDYDRIAVRLIGDGTWANTWFPPGYPLFLAGIYALCGHSLAAVRVIQAVIGALTCVLLARLGRQMFSARVGWLAGTLLAVYPGHAYMTARLMAETPYILLLVLALVLASQVAQAPRLGRAVALGAALGAGNLFKSNLYLLPPLVLLWLCGRTRSTGGAGRGAVVAAVFAFVAVTAATPLANRLASSGGATLPGNAGHTLWWANNPLADGYFVAAEDHPEGQAFLTAHGYTDRLAEADAFEKDRLFRDAALRWMWTHAEDLPALVLRKLDNAFGLFPRAASFGQRAGVVHLLSYGALLPLVVAGLALNAGRARELALLYLVPLSYALMVAVFYGTPRFTVAVMPCLLLFASDAMWRGLEAVRVGRDARLARRADVLT